MLSAVQSGIFSLEKFRLPPLEKSAPTDLLENYKKERTDEAFKEIVNQFDTLIKNVIRKHLNHAGRYSYESVLDLSQKTYQNIFLNIDKYDTQQSDGCPERWISRVARNLTLSELRIKSDRFDSNFNLQNRHTKELSPLNISPDIRFPDPAQFIEEKDYLSWCMGRLNNMDKQELDVLVKVYVEDKPPKELAAELEIPYNSLKRRLRAFKNLARELLGLGKRTEDNAAA